MPRNRVNNFSSREDGLDSQGYPKIDELEADSWLYPTNYDVRQYQLLITETSLFQNTLVCLPTGLGKTLIASVVMHAYYKWFPSGSVIFLAPTKPLVNQQIKACHDIMGIPVNDTAHLEGSINPEKRSEFWDSKRVFFCTPQTLVNDVKNGRLDVKRVVCVVFDEAHKATRGYAYTSVVRELEDNGAKFRILALSATPGSDMKKVQDVVYNLRIANVEVRTEDDPEIAPYRHDREIETVKVAEGGVASIKDAVKQELVELMRPVSRRLYDNRILSVDNPKNLNVFAIEEAESNIEIALQKKPEFSNGSSMLMRQILGDVEHMKSILNCKRVLADAGTGGLLNLMNDMKKKQLPAYVAAHRSQEGSRSNSISNNSNNVLMDLAATPRFAKLLETLRRTQNDTQVCVFKAVGLSITSITYIPRLTY